MNRGGFSRTTCRIHIFNTYYIINVNVLEFIIIFTDFFFLVYISISLNNFMYLKTPNPNLFLNEKIVKLTSTS